MNRVNLIGRLTKDPEIRFTPSQMAVTRFTLAIDRPKDKDGNKSADFISCVSFGKIAETIEQYVKKGQLFGISGQLRTGSYEDRDGKKVYTTDVVVESMDFIAARGEKEPEKAAADDNPFSGYTRTDDNIPF